MEYRQQTDLLEIAYEVSRFLLEERGLPNVLQGTCDRFVVHPSITSILIVLIDREAGGMITAETGLEKELEFVISQLRKGILPECGIQAITTEKPTALACDSSVCKSCSVKREEYTPSVCVSIKCTSSLHGFFALHTEAGNDFTKEEKILLQQLGEGLSSALRNLFYEEESRQQLQALRRSEERYELALIASQAGLWDWNIKTGEMYTSPNQIEYLDYRNCESGTESLQLAIHKNDREKVFTALNEHLAGRRDEYRSEYRVKSKSGEWLWFLDRGRVVERDENNMPVRMTGTHQNVTHQKQKENASAAIQQQLHATINHERQFLQTVIDSAGDPVMVIDLNFNILLINKTATGLIPEGVHPLAHREKKCYELFCGTDVPCDNPSYPCPVQEILRNERQMQLIHNPYHGNNINNTFELDVTPLYNRDDKLFAVIEVARDVTDRLRIERELRASQSRLYRLAHHDTLTGLPNRLLFKDRLNRAIIRAGRTQKSVAIMFLDLDKFKQINDTLGHDVGDDLLKEVAKRFQHQCRVSDTVARLGGDEFVFILEEIGSKKDVGLIAEKILHAMRRQIKVDKHVLDISTSIGIGLYPDDSPDIEGVIKCADLALYEAKEQGRNTFRFYTPALAEAETSSEGSD